MLFLQGDFGRLSKARIMGVLESPMRLFLAIILVLTSVTIARAETVIPTKERVKWELWVDGLEMPASRPQVAPVKRELPEEISRVLLKYQL
jgi:hypothetical protein